MVEQLYLYVGALPNYFIQDPNTLESFGINCLCSTVSMQHLLKLCAIHASEHTYVAVP